MKITQLPGFQNRVHDAQQTFRALLKALSHPGTPQPIFAQLQPPQGLTSACAAACLTLLDLETEVWLSPELDLAIQNWLQFHTGCRVSNHPQRANFALIQNTAQMPPLSSFNWGSAEQPERSTTLLIQLEKLDGGQSVELAGPGIAGTQEMTLPIPASFWQMWTENQSSYPLGVDIFFCVDHEVIGLPRSTHCQLKVNPPAESFAPESTLN